MKIVLNLQSSALLLEMHQYNHPMTTQATLANTHTYLKDYFIRNAQKLAEQLARTAAMDKASKEANTKFPGNSRKKERDAYFSELVEQHLPECGQVVTSEATIAQYTADMLTSWDRFAQNYIHSKPATAETRETTPENLAHAKEAQELTRHYRTCDLCQLSEVAFGEDGVNAFLQRKQLQTLDSEDKKETFARLRRNIGTVCEHNSSLTTNKPDRPLNRLIIKALIKQWIDLERKNEPPLYPPDKESSRGEALKRRTQDRRDFLQKPEARLLADMIEMLTQTAALKIAQMNLTNFKKMTGRHNVTEQETMSETDTIFLNALFAYVDSPTNDFTFYLQGFLNQRLFEPLNYLSAPEKKRSHKKKEAQPNAELHTVRMYSLNPTYSLSDPRAMDPATAAMLNIDDGNRLLSTLEERERLVLELRYGLSGNEPHTFEKIGEIICVNRQRVEQIAKKAIQKLQETTEQENPILPKTSTWQNGVLASNGSKFVNSTPLRTLISECLTQSTITKQGFAAAIQEEPIIQIPSQEARSLADNPTDFITDIENGDYKPSYRLMIVIAHKLEKMGAINEDQKKELIKSYLHPPLSNPARARHKRINEASAGVGIGS